MTGAFIMKYRVTLKSEVSRGTFYWVCDVHAGSEDEALVAGQHLFDAQTEASEEWAFTDFDVDET
jgi:hypothetical protein